MLRSRLRRILWEEGRLFAESLVLIMILLVVIDWVLGRTTVKSN